MHAFKQFAYFGDPGLAFWIFVCVFSFGKIITEMVEDSRH